LVNVEHIRDASTRLRRLPAGHRSELREAAWNHGYRRETGEADGWLFFASDISVPGEIALAVAEAGSTWFLAVDHPGVAAELDAPPAAPVPQGKRAAWGFAEQSAMRAALHRVYELSCTLPDVPLYAYQEEIAGLGDTEIDRVRKERIGQDVFRRALLRYWNGRCPLTGIAEPELLRASHIVAWADCASDAERLDVHNGLLLAAHWDAAFDAGLVSFAEDGSVLVKHGLSDEARATLRPQEAPPLPLTADHRRQLERHRAHHGF
jgi:putative restriction endonuclease